MDLKMVKVAIVLALTLNLDGNATTNKETQMLNVHQSVEMD